MKHQLIWSILRRLVYPYLKIKFGYTYEKAKDLPEKAERTLYVLYPKELL